MSSLCFNLKTEYDALKKLNAEFISACEKAGDPRALSADQIRTLQIQKQKLEQARDLLKEKVEDRETKVWKNTWKTLMVATVTSERSRYHGMTFAEVLINDAFREGVADGIKLHIGKGRLSTSSARDAAGWYMSACVLGLLSDEQKITLRAEIGKVEGMISVYVQGHINAGRVDGYEGWCGVTGLDIECQLGIFERFEWETDVDIKDHAFQKMLVDEMMHWEKKGSHTGFDTARTVTDYVAARELELLEKETRDKVLKMVERGDFQKSLAQYLLNVLNGDQIPISGTSFVEVIAAVKRLIELSRRRDPKG